MTYIRPEDRRQLNFMTSLDDLVDQKHPIRVIDAFIDQMVAANAEYFGAADVTGPGRPAYPPQCMLKLLIYGYIIGIKSSRRLEAESHRNIEVIWLMQNLRPDFKTIADFRKNNRDQIRSVAEQLSHFLEQKGYIRSDAERRTSEPDHMLNREAIERRLARVQDQMDRYLEEVVPVEPEEETEENISNPEEQGKALWDVLEHQGRRIEQLEKQMSVLLGAKPPLSG